MRDDHIGSNEEILRWDWGKHGRGGVEEGQERKNASMGSSIRMENMGIEGRVWQTTSTVSALVANWVRARR